MKVAIIATLPGGLPVIILAFITFPWLWLKDEALELIKFIVICILMELQSCSFKWIQLKMKIMAAIQQQRQVLSN